MGMGGGVKGETRPREAFTAQGSLRQASTDNEEEQRGRGCTVFALEVGQSVRVPGFTAPVLCSSLLGPCNLQEVPPQQTVAALASGAQLARDAEAKLKVRE